MASQKGMRDWMTKLNLPSGALSQFNEPDLLDDLLDHWTSNDHVQERQMLVRRLQVSRKCYLQSLGLLVNIEVYGVFRIPICKWW